MFSFVEQNTSNIQDETNDDHPTHSSSINEARFARPSRGQGDGRRNAQEQVAIDPTLAVLKATALQSTIGHPLTYARTLIQVKI